LTLSFGVRFNVKVLVPSNNHVSGSKGFARRAAGPVLYALFMIALLPALLQPIWDSDAWYHLATGRYLVEHRSFIDEDPFSFTTALATSPSEVAFQHEALNGYWLAQVIMYGWYAAGGLYGIVALRIVHFFLIFALIYIAARRLGAGLPAIMALMAPAGMLAFLFTGDRPQDYSFVLVPALLMLLEGVRAERTGGVRRPHLWVFIVIPGLIMLWANLHRGFPLGVVLVGLFAAAEGSHELLKNKKAALPYVGGLFLLVLLSTAASLVNPNGPQTYRSVISFEGSPLQSTISEYQSPFALLRIGQIHYEYFIILAVSALAFPASVRRMAPGHAAVTVFLAAVSLTAFRYIPFFLYGTIPYTAASLTALAPPWLRERRNPGYAFCAGIVVLTLLLSLARGWDEVKALAENPVERHYFPEKAADFLLEARPSGRLLNEWGAGGYLIWRLSPAMRVFADTRTMNLTALSDHLRMLSGSDEGVRLLDAYDIRVVLASGVDRISFQPAYLIARLANDPHWSLVFADEDAVVFVRGEENADIVERYALSPALAFKHIVVRARIVRPVAPPAAQAALDDLAATGERARVERFARDVAAAAAGDPEAKRVVKHTFALKKF
jgi:hypothetical protein